MSYNQFLSGTAIDPYQTNQNFHEVGVGDLLPRGGASLRPTDGANDLGSSTIWFLGSNFRDVQNESLVASYNDGSVTWNFDTHFVLTATASSIEFLATNTAGDAIPGWSSSITTDMEIYMSGAYKDLGVNTPLFLIIDQNSSTSYFSNNTYWDSGEQLWQTSTANSKLGWGLGNTPGITGTLTSFLLKMNIRTYDGNADGDFKIMGNWDVSFFQEDQVIQICQGTGTFIDAGSVNYIKLNRAGLQPGAYVGIWRRK